MKYILGMRAVITLFILGVYTPIFMVRAQQPPTTHAAACTVDEPTNLGAVKQEIKSYRSSGAWDIATQCVAQEAIKELEKYGRLKHRKHLAVIFDIDDTLLSNWDFLLLNDFGYNRERFKRWEQLGRNEVIAPLREVFYTALQLSMSVFGITGRRENQREATERNLREQGIIGWTAIYFKPMDYEASSITGYKAACRRDIKNKGYDLILNLGDQESDFLGVPQARANFKLPNPMYRIP